MNLFGPSPISIVREYRSSKRRAKKRTASIRLDISNTMHNTKHKDGRIYYKIDDNGDVVSHSVSPYSDVYLLNIEEGIRALVCTLKKVGYLTCSSCEGHTFYDRTFITIAVNTEGQYLRFKDYFKDMPFVSLKRRDVTISANSRLITHARSSKLIGIDKVENLSRDKAVGSLNRLFHRGYTDYVLFDLQIGYCVNELEWKKPMYIIRACWGLLLKKLFKRRYITEAMYRIESIPHYDM